MAHPTQFIDLITPADPAYLETGRRIHAEREDLRQTFPDPNGRAFRKWLAVSGMLEYPAELGRFFAGVPAEDLRETGCGGKDAHGHLWTALEDFEVIWESLRLFGDRPFADYQDVLDFGCGCGRVTRWFEQAMPAVRTHGCDVRAAGIDWCRANLRGDYQTNDTRPPLPWADDSMDLVIALSLFSHFDRDSSVRWMQEMARVCRPDGLILATTHGPFASWVLAHSPEHQSGLYIDAEAAVDVARRLQREQFVFSALPEGKVEQLDGPTPDYGQAFMTEAFVREAYADAVEIVALIPAGLILFQDVYVLRPTKK